MSRRLSPAPHVAVLLLAAVIGSGCASWHSIGKETPATYVAREKPDVVRFSLRDSILVLSRPTVRGDSVVGLCKSVEPHRWTVVRGDEIRGMEVHSARGTTRSKIVAGAVLAAVLAFGVALALTSGPGPIR